jgi:cation transport regulator ChaC
MRNAENKKKRRAYACDEGGSCRGVAQRAKAAHLTSVICTLKPRLKLVPFREIDVGQASEPFW